MQSKNFKFVFKVFNEFFTWKDDSILLPLEKYCLILAEKILQFLEPQKSFMTTLIEEKNTLGGSIWPKYHNKYFVITEKQEITGHFDKKTPFYAEIRLTFDYFNPRDGDGWTMNVHFQSPDSRGDYDFEISTHSHYIENKLCIRIKNGKEDFLKDIENILNEVFNEKTEIQIDKQS